MLKNALACRSLDAGRGIFSILGKTISSENLERRRDD
jgi:hypothetical protein